MIKDDLLVGVTLTDQQEVVQYDLTYGDREDQDTDDKDGDGTPDWYDEGYQVLSFIPNR